MPRIESHEHVFLNSRVCIEKSEKLLSCPCWREYRFASKNFTSSGCAANIHKPGCSHFSMGRILKKRWAKETCPWCFAKILTQKSSLQKAKLIHWLFDAVWLYHETLQKRQQSIHCIHHIHYKNHPFIALFLYFHHFNGPNSIVLQSWESIGLEC